MNFKKTIISSILCAATVMGASQSANATAYATSVLSLTDMQITLGNGGGRVAYLSDFNGPNGGLSGNNTGSANVTLNGAAAGPYSATTNVTSGLGITLPGLPVLGAGAPSGFTANPVPATITSTYSVANASLTGSIIDLTNGSVSPTPAAVAQTMAEASLSSNGLGDAHSSLGLSSTFNFTATSALSAGVTLSFKYLAYLAIQLTNDEVIPGFVDASYKWGITLHNNSTGLDVVIPGTPVTVLNKESSFDAPFNGSQSIGNTTVAGPLSFFSGALVEGNIYKLTINQNTDVTVVSKTNNVPEPSSLFLIGLGILGVAWSAKRKTADSLIA